MGSALREHPGRKKRSSAGRSSQFRSGQRNKRHSSRKSGYQGFIDEARRIMVIEDLLVRGEIGFDDACTTALLCGALMAMGGILPPPNRTETLESVCCACISPALFCIES